MTQFKIGDRVQVINDSSLRGKVGTVVGFDVGDFVAIEFDEANLSYLNSTCGGRAKAGHGLFKQAKNLILLEQKNDLSSVRVGDRLWHTQLEECEVVKVVKESHFPIFVKTTDGIFPFTLDGKNLETDPLPSVFWDKPTIICPPRPVRVVTKTVSGWVGFSGGNGIKIHVIENNSGDIILFKTEAEANYFADLNPLIWRAVFVRHTYERKV